MFVRRLVALASAAAFVFACGSFDAAPGDAADAGDAGNGAVEASDAGEGCSPTAPFGAPQPIVATASIAEDTILSLNGAETIGVFSSRRLNGSYDLFLVRRTSRFEPFGQPIRLPEAPDAAIAGSQWELDPTITTDGLRIVYLQSSDENGRLAGLKLASRASLDEGFGTVIDALAPDPDGGAAPEGFRRFPFIVGDGSALYNQVAYGVDDAGDAGTPLVRLERFTRTSGSTPTYSRPQPVPELEKAAVVATNIAETRIFYSRRDSKSDPYDIWTATRANKSEPWSGMALVTELSSPQRKTPGFVSEDGCRLYFTILGEHHVAKRGF